MASSTTPSSLNRCPTVPFKLVQVNLSPNQTNPGAEGHLEKILKLRAHILLYNEGRRASDQDARSINHRARHKVAYD